MPEKCRIHNLEVFYEDVFVETLVVSKLNVSVENLFVAEPWSVGFVISDQLSGINVIDLD